MAETVNNKVEDFKKIKLWNLVILIISIASIVGFAFLFLIEVFGIFVLSVAGIVGLILLILMLVKMSEYKTDIKNYSTYMILFILGLFIPILSLVGSIMVMTDKDLQA